MPEDTLLIQVHVLKSLLIIFVKLVETFLERFQVAWVGVRVRGLGVWGEPPALGTS
jgi:hypothetical protein